MILACSGGWHLLTASGCRKSYSLCFCLVACVYLQHHLYCVASKSLCRRQAERRTNVCSIGTVWSSSTDKRDPCLVPFWHLMGEIELSASELKVAVNAPLKDNGTGHLPRAHSTGRALFRIISFQKWKRMPCVFYSDTETWKGNFIFVEKPPCSCL